MSPTTPHRPHRLALVAAVMAVPSLGCSVVPLLQSEPSPSASTPVSPSAAPAGPVKVGEQLFNQAGYNAAWKQLVDESRVKAVVHVENDGRALTVTGTGLQQWRWENGTVSGPTTVEPSAITTYGRPMTPTQARVTGIDLFLPKADKRPGTEFDPKEYAAAWYLNGGRHYTSDTPAQLKRRIHVFQPRYFSPMAVVSGFRDFDYPDYGVTVLSPQHGQKVRETSLTFKDVTKLLADPAHDVQLLRMWWGRGVSSPYAWVEFWETGMGTRLGWSCSPCRPVQEGPGAARGLPTGLTVDHMRTALKWGVKVMDHEQEGQPVVTAGGKPGVTEVAEGRPLQVDHYYDESFHVLGWCSLSGDCKAA